MPLKVGDGPVAPVPPAPREEGKRKTGSLGGREVAFSGSHLLEGVPKSPERVEAKPLFERTISVPMAERLKEIVLNAAKRDAASLGKTEFDALVSKYATTPELKKEFEALEPLRTEAEGLYNTLCRCTCRELGEAFASETEGPIVKLVKRAVEVQFELSDRLGEIYRRTGGRFAGMLPAMRRCDMRGAEINYLVRMLGAEVVANELAPGTFPASDPRASKTASEVFPGLIVAMHGTGEALDALERQLKPLANRFDRLKKNAAEGRAEWQDTVAIKGELILARDALRAAAEDGIAFPGEGGVFRPDEGLLKALSGILDEIAIDIAGVAAEYARATEAVFRGGEKGEIEKTRLFRAFGQSVLERLKGERASLMEAKDLQDTIAAIFLVFLVVRGAAIFNNLRTAGENRNAEEKRLLEIIEKTNDAILEMIDDMEEELEKRGEWKMMGPILEAVKRLIESSKDEGDRFHVQIGAKK